MLRHLKGFLAGVALVAPFVFGVACGPAEKPAPPAAPAAQPAGGQPSAQPAAPGRAVKRDGVITIQAGTGAEVTDGDPHKTVAGAALWAPIADSALEINTQTLQVEPAIAKSWEISSNGLVYTFKIRDDGYFHNIPPVNGRQVTAADVAYTLMRATGKYNPEEPAALWPRFSALANMDKAEAVDQSTVKVTLTKRNSGFLQGVADQRLAIVPKEIVDAHGNLSSAKRETMVSTGAFFVESFSTERGAIWKANPKYWNQGADGKPLPHVDEIRGLNLRDKATVNAAMISKQIDVIQHVYSGDATQIKKSLPDVQETKRGGGTGCGLRYNLQRFPWTDLRVRRAFDMIVDRDMMGNGHWGAGYWIHLAPVAESHYPNWALPQDELTKYPGRKSGDARAADIAEAKRLLKEAGITQLKVEVSGSGAAGGVSGYLEIPLILVENFNRDLKDAGVTAEFVNFGANQSKNVAERRFDVNWFCPTFSTDPGLWLHENYHSEGSRNYMGWSDAKFDAMWEQQQAELDPAKRKAILADAQRHILDQIAMSLTVNSPYVTLMQSYVKGVVPYMTGTLGAGATAQLRYAWLDK